MGSGILNRIAPSTGQASTQALQCQHSFGYATNGVFFFSEPKNTSSEQMSAHWPQWLHFFLSITGGIFKDSWISSAPFRNRPAINLFNNHCIGHILPPALVVGCGDYTGTHVILGLKSGLDHRCTSFGRSITLNFSRSV